MQEKIKRIDLIKLILPLPLLFFMFFRYIIAREGGFLAGIAIYFIILGFYIFVYYLEKLMTKKEFGDYKSQIDRLNDIIRDREDVIKFTYKQSECINNKLKNSDRHSRDIMNELKLKNEELDALRDVARMISSTYQIDKIIEYAYELLRRFTDCDRYFLVFMDKYTNELVCRYEFGDKMFNEVGKVYGFDTTIGKCFNTRSIIIKTNVYMDNRCAYGDKIAIPFCVSGECLGVAFIESGVRDAFKEVNTSFLESLMGYAAMVIKNAELFNNIIAQKQEIEALYEKAAAVNEELNSYIKELDEARVELNEKNLELTKYYNDMQNGYLQTVIALANSIEANDAYTAGHCQRVMEIACRIGIKLGLNGDEITNLRYAAILHDIGKIGIPASILNKKGSLTEQEFCEIRKHPQISYNILKDVGFIKEGLDAILQHHERYDGKGYPDGLKGDKICVFAKVLCIADAFDAMTSDRPYRKSMTVSEALAEIERCKGTQFDPDIADAFIELSLKEMRTCDALN